MHHGRLAHVRFGSKADIDAPPPDVRFTPESGHWNRPAYYLGRVSSGNLAIFAAIRRVSSGLILIKVRIDPLCFKLHAVKVQMGDSAMSQKNEIILRREVLPETDEELLALDVSDDALERAVGVGLSVTLNYGTALLGNCGCPL